MTDFESLSFDEIVANWSKYKDEYIKSDTFKKEFRHRYSYNVFETLEQSLLDELLKPSNNKILEAHYFPSQQLVKNKIKACKRLHLHYKIVGKRNTHLDIHMPANWQWHLTPPNPVEYNLTVMNHKARNTTTAINKNIDGIVVFGGLLLFAIFVFGGIASKESIDRLYNNINSQLNNTGHNINITQLEYQHTQHVYHIGRLDKLIAEHKKEITELKSKINRDACVYAGFLFAVLVILGKLYDCARERMHNDWKRDILNSSNRVLDTMNRNINQTTVDFQQQLTDTTNLLTSKVNAATKQLNQRLRSVVYAQKK